jgi:hypothetical protein
MPQCAGFKVSKKRTGVTSTALWLGECTENGGHFPGGIPREHPFGGAAEVAALFLAAIKPA